MQQPPPILLAADSQQAVLLLQRAFQKAGIRNDLRVVHDADEAIAYMTGIGKYANRAEYPFPAFLLLGVPTTESFRVLCSIRANGDLFCT
jgi:hypothetical protein